MPRGKKVTDIFGSVSLQGRAITALYIDPNTNMPQKVQVPGTPHIPGYNYFGDYEAQFLYAEADGKTKLRFHPSKPSRGGSSGASIGGYLSPENTTSLRKEKNAGEPSKPRAKAEPFTGYRMLIDTADYSPTFNQKSGVYDVSEQGHLSNPKKDQN